MYTYGGHVFNTFATYQDILMNSNYNNCLYIQTNIQLFLQLTGWIQYGPAYGVLPLDHPGGEVELLVEQTR